MCSAVAVFGFYQIIQGGQVGKGKEEFICRKRLLCLPPTPPLVLVLDFLCSLFSSFVVFLQGQDSRLHILCDVRKECKELNESLDEMCPSRGRLISNETPNLADAL